MSAEGCVTQGSVLLEKLMFSRFKHTSLLQPITYITMATDTIDLLFRDRIYIFFVTYKWAQLA